ncbi:2-C-methyl-D-erythritol 2,4-cyclodiphosphate synthase [Magnetococcus marinus MC-1]|uniref:2-C-methyl-D-erythritol 2,4-cyclodiphosphate synthase n=1 Tax=Magnetococcus marinus (strain ATCC BAA-1437 / JCM 17883 / MC-1) TaxID=156889 RepID=A0LB26_MAGMM|nr:2-C-methyl-D-erythritol 2,4-cyclodiphosphate synthase [Magnetococcus marinus]ABK45169.1 2-C-methyl-D-erythritol 2,4-cyclodiphosphate synthase [Magnetococcus marinus MC-1]
MNIRVGQGFDVHRWIEGRPLMLGGIEVPHNQGLLGHSDADVLLHAICDALLGAMGRGDIGRHFPDNDPHYAGIASIKLVKHVYGYMQEQGWQLINLDATVICQQPKLAPHIPRMETVIAAALGCDVEQVNVKATTTEKLGFTGRNEGVAAQCVVLLQRP